MQNLLKTGRWFYAIGIAAIAFHQFFYADFSPLFLPAWPAWVPGVAIFSYLFSILIIALCLGLVFSKKARLIALVLSGIFLVLILFYQLPYEVFADPGNAYLSSWSFALKEMAFAGGALAIADAIPANNDRYSFVPAQVEKLIPFARIFFCITMILFGIEHFLYTQYVIPMVPAWIPWHKFWTYFAGVALICSGLCIILKILPKLTATLLGIMLFLWFILLHIPGAWAHPYTAEGNEVTAAFTALAFSGIAFVIAGSYRVGQRI